MTELSDRMAALAARDLDAAHALAEAATDPVDRALGRAVVALHREDAEAARRFAEEARGLGGGAPAEHYLTAAYAMLGDVERAIASARAAVALDASPRSRTTLGSLLLAAGEAEEAAAVLRQVVADEPGNRDAHENLATAAFRLADYGTAMSGYARAFELDPSNRQPIRLLMEMFAEMGKWLGAVAALELSREGKPPAEVAVALDLAMLELVELVARKYPGPRVDAGADRTVTHLIGNAAARPPSVQLVVARALIDIERFAEAGTLAHGLARGAHALDAADRGNLHYVEGLLAEHAHDPARALDRYVRALAADPARVDACVNATSLLLADASAEAFDRLGALLEQVAPEARAAHPSLLFNEAIYLLRRDRPDDARDRLAQLLEVTGGEGEVAALARQALAELTAPA